MKLMTKSGMVLRFEAEIAKPVYPEDADRTLKFHLKNM